MVNSTRKPATRQSKPYKYSPLFPHATGRRATKIRAKLHHVGAWRESNRIDIVMVLRKNGPVLTRIVVPELHCLPMGRCEAPASVRV